MLLNYLKIALRAFLKDKTFGILNLLGLSFGMLSFLIIVQFVRYEWSYDQQSPYANEIWRVYNETRPEKGEVTLDANTHSAIGPALKRDLPEVVEYARLYNRNEHEVMFLHDNKPIKIKGAWFTDPGFLKMFPQQFIAGEAQICLSKPYDIVISESTARTLFGAVEVIGETLQVPAGVFQGTYTVRGVVKDTPENTHLKFNILASYATRYAKGHEDNWGSYWEYTYFLVQPNTDMTKVDHQLALYSKKHLTQQGLHLHKQALTDIHLHSALTYEIEPNGNGRMVNFLSIIAIFILLIAFFNYVNMMTAKALRRAKEVGLRKVIGASREQLIGQFLMEGALLNGLALVLALVCLQASVHWFGTFVNRPLSDFLVFDRSFVLLITGIFVSSLLFACLYPALVLSHYRPIQVLKGYFGRSKEGQSLRKGLVVFQFACSTILIIGVGVVEHQLRFLRNHDLGLSMDQIVAIKMPNLDYRNDTTSYSRFVVFEQELKKLPGVLEMTTSNITPGLGISTISGGSGGLHRVDQPDNSMQSAIYYLDVAPNFFHTYQIPILTGDLYDVKDRASLRGNIILNESACRIFGFLSPENAVGQGIAFDRSPDRHITIRGVVADFHIEGLQQPTRPTMYTLNPRIVNGYLSLKVKPEQLSLTLAEIQHTWGDLFPLNLFEYWFLDDNFSQQYANEKTLSKAFNLFAGLAIFIACLGLFGLATYTAQQRTKEIGIRKILGASIGSIVAMLSKDFLQLVFIALLIATPIAYFLLENWLEEYAYRISISWWLLVLAGLVTIAIAFLTVSWKSWRAAIANPIESIKDE